jgi:ABC-type uncharacterized transport system fused permease/ATPase subunit
MGEQQRLAFVRLLALFTLTPNKDQLIQQTLLFLDESTSAIDMKTEKEIYLNLIKIGVWFVTISHRSSLIDLHTKLLKFSSCRNREETIKAEESMKVHIPISSTIEDDDENKARQEGKNDYKPIETKQFQVSFI